MANRTRRLGGVGVVAASLIVLTTACAPSHKVNVGMKDFATNVVYGAATSTSSTPTTAAPFVPGANLSPGFPSVIVPAPPPIGFVPPPLPPAVEVIPDPCPPADPKSRAIKAPTTFATGPAAGTYSYKQQGSLTVPPNKPLLLPPTGRRTITRVAKAGGTSSWDVVITQFGIKTTTSYAIVRQPGRPEIDGLYITHIVQETPGLSPDEFLPEQPGLRIFAEPARSGDTWRSVASDPAHAISVLIDGTTRDVRKVDVCGLFVEGWAADLVVTVKRPLDPGGTNTKDYVTQLSYVAGTQLGGVILSDSVRQKGTDRGVADVDQNTAAQLEDLAPR